MNNNRIIVNASPFIVTVNSGFGFLWEKLFDQILVPEEVFKEITTGKHNDPVADWIGANTMINRLEVIPSQEVLAWNLGAGETAVLSYCYRNLDTTAVVDDLLAKKCAITFGIKILSTGSILIFAKKKGYIDSVRNALHKMRDNGMWISNQVIELIAQKAGESE